jgi:hypothetical protein
VFLHPPASPETTDVKSAATFTGYIRDAHVRLLF